MNIVYFPYFDVSLALSWGFINADIGMFDFLYLRVAEWERGCEYYSQKMLARIIQSHCHFRGKINRMDRHYQGGKDAISRCGE